MIEVAVSADVVGETVPEMTGLPSIERYIPCFSDTYFDQIAKLIALVSLNTEGAVPWLDLFPYSTNVDIGLTEEPEPKKPNNCVSILLKS